MIAVLGATGLVGGEVARLLAERGADAVALVRRPGAAAVSLPALTADLERPETVRAALDGVDRLFLLTPHVPEQERLEATAVAAAAAAGVSRIVKVSGGAASLGPNGATPTAVAHWRSEQRIEASGLGFQFLRPSFFMQNLSGMVTAGRVLAAPVGRTPIAMVDARDVAACAAALLLDPEAADAAWQLTGPRPVALDEVARHLGLRYLPVRPGVAERAMRRRGADRAEVRHAVRMAAYFAAGADTVVTDHVEQLTGSAPRPVEVFLDEQRAALVPRRKEPR